MHMCSFALGHQIRINSIWYCQAAINLLCNYVMNVHHFFSYHLYITLTVPEYVMSILQLNT